MAQISVRPETFSLLAYDARVIRALVAQVADGVGLPGDVELIIDIDESTPLGKTKTTLSGRRVEIAVEGGAFEDPHALRHLSESEARLVLGRLLYRVRDRLDPSFGDAPPDDSLTLGQHTAWDVYAAGRYARLAGVDGREARRRYAFRLRHGFTDVADMVFDRLWHGSGLTWADLEAAGAEARSAGNPAGSR